MFRAVGLPKVKGIGALEPGSLNTVALSGAVSSSPALLVVGLSPLVAPFKGGVLVPSPDLLIPRATNTGGADAWAFVLPELPANLAFYLQYWLVDDAATLGWSASNGRLGVTS